MSPDAGIFEHLGWSLTLMAGCTSPDASRCPAADWGTGVAIGGDMYRLHLLSVVLMSGAVCAT